MAKRTITNADKYELLTNLKEMQAETVKNKVDMSVQAAKILAYIYKNEILADFFESKRKKFDKVNETELLEAEKKVFEHIKSILYYVIKKENKSKLRDIPTFEEHKMFEISFEFKDLLNEVTPYIDKADYKSLPNFNSDGIVEYYFSVIVDLYNNISNCDVTVLDELVKLKPSLSSQDKYDIVKRIGRTYDYRYLLIYACDEAHGLNYRNKNTFVLLRVSILKVLSDLINYIGNMNLDDVYKKEINKNLKLTNRQIEVYNTLKNNLSYDKKEIANDLGIDTRTVESHINDICSRLSTDKNGIKALKAYIRTQQE